MKTIYDKITPIFQTIFDEDDLIPTPEMTSNDVEFWDSLSNIRLFMTLEKKFNIRFTTEEVTDLQDVDHLVRMIHSKLGG